MERSVDRRLRVAGGRSVVVAWYVQQPSGQHRIGSVTDERRMILENLTNRGAGPALINTLTFAEARQRMLAENVANWQTPGYKTKHLDVGTFQGALRRALDEKGGDPNKRFVVGGSKEFRSKKSGGLRVTPQTQPAHGVLFHDGTNLSIEQQMSDLSKNAMMHQMASTILKGYFDGMRKAIRGQM